MNVVNLSQGIRASARELRLNGVPIHTQKWQSMDISGSGGHKMLETIGVYWTSNFNFHLDYLREQCHPNLPWADDHFEERAGGIPINPGEQYKNWPYYRNNPSNDKFRTNEQFSHTYMERIWANKKLYGIRYTYGNLGDLVNLLKDEPDTRQAYLPIWFPEDTGVTHGERVPCSTGYHFMLRDGVLNCWYHLRSCDLVRHLQDDVYLAARLAMWVNEKANLQADFGRLYLTIGSLHCWLNEKDKIRKMEETGERIG